MNKCLVTLIFTLYAFGQVQGQQLYFKPYIRYHQSVNSENAPQYFALEIIIPNGPNYVTGIHVLSGIKEFSLAGGFKYGGTVGYQFSNILGVEAGIDYFKTNKSIKADMLAYNPSGITNWNYQSLQASPSFTFRKKNKKSSLTGKIGVIIGVVWLENSVRFQDNNRKIYQFDKNISLGYMLGFEYNYYFKHVFSFVVECGLEHSTYTPKKASLVEIRGFTGNSVQSQTEYTKEINYVNNIQNLPVNSNYYGYRYTSDQNKPEVRIKEAIRLSSVYLGIGIKYNFSIK
jgi:hypothetical protein